MSFWISIVFALVSLQSIQLQAQQLETDSTTPPAKETLRVLIVKKDWNITQAYADVFRILSDPNTCSRFYGGPRAATTVLNGFVTLMKPQPLVRNVSFEMAGRPRVIRDSATGAWYRLFEKTMVNTNGSFYQRREDPLRKFPSDVGSFAPGSRQARALILLHELGHLIQSDDGDWLIPDDGHDGPRSQANTLRVQNECRPQLDALK
jgi:hypothetical protein